MSIFELYRQFRHQRTDQYLGKTISGHRIDLVTWQPLWWIFLKLLLLCAAAYVIYRFHDKLGFWMHIGFTFFRFSEVYKFTLPDRAAFNWAARAIMLLVIAYYGLPVVLNQAGALFSVLAVDRLRGRIYYLKNWLMKKDLYIIPQADITMIVLKQTLPGRLFDIGTVVIQKTNGEELRIASLARVAGAVQALSDIKVH